MPCFSWIFRRLRRRSLNLIFNLVQYIILHLGKILNVICKHISILDIFDILKIHIWITFTTSSSFFHFLLILSTATCILWSFSCLQNWFEIFKFFIIICRLSHYSVYNCLLLSIYSVLANCHKVILLYSWREHFLLLIWIDITSLVIISLVPCNRSYRSFATSWFLRISIILRISILIFTFIIKDHNVCSLVFRVLPKCILIERFIGHVIIFYLMEFQKWILISFLCVPDFLVKCILSFLILVYCYQRECFIKLRWINLLGMLFVMVREVIWLLNYNLIIRLLTFHIIAIHKI